MHNSYLIVAAELLDARDLEGARAMVAEVLGLAPESEEARELLARIEGVEAGLGLVGPVPVAVEERPAEGAVEALKVGGRGPTRGDAVSRVEPRPAVMGAVERPEEGARAAAGGPPAVEERSAASAVPIPGPPASGGGTGSIAVQPGQPRGRDSRGAGARWFVLGAVAALIALVMVGAALVAVGSAIVGPSEPPIPVPVPATPPVAVDPPPEPPDPGPDGQETHDEDAGWEDEGGQGARPGGPGDAAPTLEDLERREELDRPQERRETAQQVHLEPDVGDSFEPDGGPPENGSPPEDVGEQAPAPAPEIQSVVFCGMMLEVVATYTENPNLRDNTAILARRLYDSIASLGPEARGGMGVGRATDLALVDLERAVETGLKESTFIRCLTWFGNSPDPHFAYLTSRQALDRWALQGYPRPGMSPPAPRTL